MLGGISPSFSVYVIASRFTNDFSNSMDEEWFAQKIDFVGGIITNALSV